MNRSLLLFLLALSLLFVLPGCGGGQADDDDDTDDDDSTPDPADTDDDGDGLSENEGDCDDSDAAISPNESEATCDGVDNDCDPGTPDDIDGDADGVLCSTDCDDEDAANFPGNTETCDGSDNDCDGLDDAGNPGVVDQESDADGDGQWECQGDCDDTDATTYSGATELCDGIDNDCNGLDDMGLPGTGGQETDGDGDGQRKCQGDCDDTDATTFSGATELCDGNDNDCNGLDDMGNSGVAGEETDNDGDGQRKCQGDCDDTDAMTYLGAQELLLDNSDRDCDGLLGGSGSLSLADDSFVGENSYDHAGYSVSSAGDVDGDGLDDLLVGAHGNDDGGSGAGQVYLILGSSLGASGIIDLSLADYSFVGENSMDTAGGSVSSAGDVDGDGLDDLLVGAAQNSDGGTYAGKAYLILGSSLGASGIIDLSLADYSFVGENGGDEAGISVSSAGDVDGDGRGDLLLGAHGNEDVGALAGKVYLILGSSLGSASTISLSLADYSFVAQNSWERAGHSVSSAGDVDGDGRDDLLVGAHNNDAGGDSAGKIYLILAGSLGPSSTISLSLADYSFVGENVGDKAGISVSSAGDVDADGLDDLLVGAYYNDDGGGSPAYPWDGAGKAYLILGSSLGASPVVDLSLADYSFLGENSGDRAGISLSSAGDVDGDGLDDLLVGASRNDDGGSNAGKAYLILGSSLGASPVIDLSLADYSFVGENSDDYAGNSVSSAGDVDGDGLDDLLVGAPGNDDGGSSAGKAYLVLSHLSTPDYAGLWSVSPTTSYSCALATVALDHLVIDHVAPYATLPGSPELTMDSSSPQPGLLEGGFVTSATPDSFAVTRTESLDSGNCTATWSVIGSYTGIDTLSADFTATFAGSCGGCTNQSFAVTATR